MHFWGFKYIHTHSHTQYTHTYKRTHTHTHISWDTHAFTLARVYIALTGDT